jgi:hypothetical protein
MPPTLRRTLAVSTLFDCVADGMRQRRSAFGRRTAELSKYGSFGRHTAVQRMHE